MVCWFRLRAKLDCLRNPIAPADGWKQDQHPFRENRRCSAFQLQRGAMIDCSRHFVSLDFLKKQIDLMAYYKLNRFHWHLTDGPGWRIEIKKISRTYRYCSLANARHMERVVGLGTNISAWRHTRCLWRLLYTRRSTGACTLCCWTTYHRDPPRDRDAGSFRRGAGCLSASFVYWKPYTSSEFCIGNDQTFEFLENVLTEVIDIFPSEFIHVGGDEASREHWKKNALNARRG